MSATNPPDPNVNTFNNLYWITGDNTLTQDQADKRYLRFPTAQGTENLAAINVNGLATFNSDIVVADGAETSTISQDAVTNALTIANNVNTGAILFKTTNSSSVLTTPLSITSDIFNISSASSAIIGAGSNTMNISSSGITNTKPITLSGAANTDRVVNSVYYQLQDANNLTNTTGQIYAATDNIYIQNNTNSGDIFIQAKDAGGTTKQPVEISSDSVNITGTGLGNIPLSATNTSQQKQMYLIPANAASAWNASSLDNETTILAKGSAKDNSTLVLSTWSDNYSAVKVSSTSISMGVGGFASPTPTNSVVVDNTTNTTTTAGTNLSVQNTNVSFTSTTPPTSSQTIPAANDSSNKIPTTAWVQSAIAGSVSQSNSAEHYSTALNNVYPFGTTTSTIPYINFADVGTYASTYGVQYWDAVTFDFVFNLTISGVNTNFTDAGGVGINNNQVSGTIYVYPTAFTTTQGVVAYPYFYLTGGINSTSSGTATYYNCPVTAYTPNGRPFWVNNLLNQANIAVCMPCNTYNDGTNARLIFQFAPINWNTTTQCNWNLSLTLRNSGKIPASKITTQNFNINNI